MCDVSDPAIEEAYLDVRSDTSETDWAVFGYNDAGAIEVQGTGSDGVDGMKAKFDDATSQYAYLRITSGDEESKRSKFVLVSWCGENVGALKRARMSVHKASIKEICKDFGVEMHFTDMDEVDSEEINTAVKKASGADYSGSLN